MIGGLIYLIDKRLAKGVASDEDRIHKDDKRKG